MSQGPVTGAPESGTTAEPLDPLSPASAPEVVPDDADPEDPPSVFALPDVPDPDVLVPDIAAPEAAVPDDAAPDPPLAEPVAPAEPLLPVDPPLVEPAAPEPLVPVIAPAVVPEGPCPELVPVWAPDIDAPAVPAAPVLEPAALPVAPLDPDVEESEPQAHAKAEIDRAVATRRRGMGKCMFLCTLRGRPPFCYAGYGEVDSTCTEAAVNEPAVACSVIVPGVFVDRRMASALPLKAAREGPAYGSWFVESPLSTPASVPAPETENVISFEAWGTMTPLESTTSASTYDRSLPSAVIVVRSAVSLIAAAAPAVCTVSVTATVPFLVAFASRVPFAKLTVQSKCPELAFDGSVTTVFEPRDVPFRKSSTLSALL